MGRLGDGSLVGDRGSILWFGVAPAVTTHLKTIQQVILTYTRYLSHVQAFRGLGVLEHRKEQLIPLDGLRSQPDTISGTGAGPKKANFSLFERGGLRWAYFHLRIKFCW